MNTVSVRLMNKKLTTSTLYELDSFTKYSIAVNPLDNFIYAKNPHFGWLRCHWTGTEHLPKEKLRKENILAQ